MVSPSRAVTDGQPHTYVPNAYKPACRCAYPCIICGGDAQDEVHQVHRDQRQVESPTRGGAPA
jgi:hypothetical protein